MITVNKCETIARGVSYSATVDNDSQGRPTLDLDALLEPAAHAQFRRLCLPTSSSDLAGLAGVVRMHLAHIRESATDRTDIEMAVRISSAFEDLLTAADGFSDDERALIRGAVEYFLLVDDADGDLDDFLGFDDDARILNSVLDRLGQSEQKITFA